MMDEFERWHKIAVMMHAPDQGEDVDFYAMLKDCWNTRGEVDAGLVKNFINEHTRTELYKLLKAVAKAIRSANHD